MTAEGIWRSSFKVDLPGTTLSCSREGLILILILIIIVMIIVP